MRALIDTCVIIDAIQERKPFADAAGTIVRLAAHDRFEAVITAKEATDVYYLTHHFFHDTVETHAAMNLLFTVFAVADTTASDVVWALASPISDYEDAVMATTAFREGMDCIVTRNVKDYQGSRVPVLTPDDFLKALDGGEDSQEDMGANDKE